MTTPTTIHRVQIRLTDETTVELCGYVRSLHVAPDRKLPDTNFEVWYEASDAAESAIVRFLVYGTGGRFDHNPATAQYVGTVFTHDDRMVWHVYAELGRVP